MPISIVGPWEGGPEGYQGQFVFSDAHYCGFFVAADRKPFHAESPTENEEAEAFRALMAGAGAYEVTESALILHTKYDRLPRAPYSNRFDASLDGDILRLKSPAGRVWTLRRAS